VRIASIVASPVLVMLLPGGSTDLEKRGAAAGAADWGIDYMHLARYGGRWKLIQVVRQEAP
jgi:hypothetical protein